jgi:hypothetical protein
MLTNAADAKGVFGLRTRWWSGMDRFVELILVFG